jgi:hypothetical protein
MTSRTYQAATRMATLAFATGGCLVVSGAYAKLTAGDSDATFSLPAGEAGQDARFEKTTDKQKKKTAQNTRQLPVGDMSAADQDGWTTQVIPGVPLTAVPSATPKGIAPPQYVGVTSKEKTSAKETADDDEEKGDAKKVAGGDLFQADPSYGEAAFTPEEQVQIYGGKREVDPPRPPIEIGRQQYTSGSYEESSTLLGAKNPLLPGLAVYGDWRTAVAYNSNGGKDIAQVATRLNLDVDFKFTGTERIHAFFTPLQKNNEFTRYEFGGGDGNDRFNDELDAEPQTLFFEGDFGSLYTGFSGQEASFDRPSRLASSRCSCRTASGPTTRSSAAP